MMNATEATREVYWNISGVWVMYLLLAPTLAIAGWGLWRRIRLWKVGQPALRMDRLGDRLDLFLKNGLGQGRTIRNRYVALFHTGLYAGFLVLIAATTVVLIHEDSKYVLPFQIPLMKGWFYLIFQSLIVDLFGLWVLLAAGLAMARRFVTKPVKLVYTQEAGILLGLIFLMAAQGFLVEGWRIAVTDDPWGTWSPVGWLVGAFSSAFVSDEGLTLAHRFTWWFHMVTSFAFLAYAPYTKMAHAITAPLNIFTANLDGYGSSLKTIDFETAPVLGVNSLEQMTWKDLLDLDACTECGRCTDVCPANTVGKALSPRDIILDLQKVLHEKGDELVQLAKTRSEEEGGTPPTEPQDAAIPIIQDDHAYSQEALFQCTTCAACMEACPVHIEQMPKIVDARRFLVMEQAEFPEGMMNAVTSLESRQHPFPGTQFSRTDWAEGLDLPVMADMESPDDSEVLFWVGCGGALVERNHSTVQATAKLLKKANVKFSILGREESCSGDPARRIGNEFLFEMLAKGNVDTLKRYDVKKIVTSCPHCFNTFANEYPNFGGKYEVYHHSEYLAKLIEEGELETKQKMRDKVTFHDPCYLGRHNGVYKEPRKVMEASANHTHEMERSGSNSFCCGGGGGMMFVDEPVDQRVNQERAQQAIDSGAEVVAVGCPFCATMLEDGVGARKGDKEVRVMDIAEMLLEASE